MLRGWVTYVLVEGMDPGRHYLPRCQDVMYSRSSLTLTITTFEEHACLVDHDGLTLSVQLNLLPIPYTQTISLHAVI